MTTMSTTRDDAREMARERLPEVLGMVVPGFHPERPFRCLNPQHEDRHPSMRYLSRSNTVRCFSCDWSGDAFDVVGAIYGLSGGEAFRKTYDLLGIDVERGAVQMTRRPRATVAVPEERRGPEWERFVLDLIYPAGWDAAEAIPLPMPLQVTADVESRLAGILARYPEDTLTCRGCGLEGRHFNDAELGEFYREMVTAVFFDNSTPAFVDWLEAQAAPRHMLRKLVGFIINAGQRRELEAQFAFSYSHFQNEEPADVVFGNLLDQVERITGERFDVPVGDESALRKRLDDIFQRYFANDDICQIIAEYRWRGDAMPHVRN